ncbi:GDSL-type esterase/lipase family protein [Rubellicoccus peritrichatus]|uniref:GDSL-type esterase/lipase family protein n=1 Tax=Rubellicoccus peritrichatus TaxID=3080537 RepID=A0AAQ3L6P3_9BACT|nr:GDSL-type esterase/lipase family protein [Puniceicoccus sp. CR14]WOO40325.1 GDSL-type esterase/lipase family protein [Puniceicoccus sp. CR14]
MKSIRLITYLVFAISIAGISAQAQSTDAGKNYPDPSTRFVKPIEKFEAADAKKMPPEGAIVCIGSSSMRGWHGSIQKDLDPLTIIPRGFGGSNMNDALYYADRIVIPYKPRAVVVYEGDNDVAQKVSPEKIADTTRAFVDKIHAELPDCRIYFLSVKPSIRRWDMWPDMVKTNELIEAICAEDDRLTYIDVATVMLDEEGMPKKHIFKKDDLHMTRDGYALWRDQVRPVLIEKELEFEQQ